MNIDDLLTNAAKYTNLAVLSTADNNDRALFAQIAQACAQTAQAMILAKCTSVLSDAETRVFLVDTGN